MAKVTNEEMITSVVNDMSSEHSAKLMMDGKILPPQEMLNVFKDFPTTKNEFINTLTNKVTKVMIYSKIYKNPLVSLKQGTVEYGDSIEELFVQMALMKNFAEHWDEDGSDEADLIRKMTPKVTALYIQRNIDKKFKTSVSDKQLRKAFFNSNGLSNLVQQIVGSITTSINFNEFEMMKSTLFKAVDGVSYNGQSLKDIPADAKGKKMHAIEVADYDTKPSNLVEKIRTVTGDMQFMSKDFNMASELNFCDPENLVLITTSEVEAKLDVNVLAHAFNVSHTDLKTRTIKVDKLDIRGAKAGAYTTDDDGIASPVDCTNTSALPDGKKPLAILMDKEFLQIWDLHQGAGTFYNPSGEYTNHFASREYMMAVCLFANAVLFYK